MGKIVLLSNAGYADKDARFIAWFRGKEIKADFFCSFFFLQIKAGEESQNWTDSGFIWWLIYYFIHKLK